MKIHPIEVIVVIMYLFLTYDYFSHDGSFEYTAITLVVVLLCTICAEIKKIGENR